MKLFWLTLILCAIAAAQPVTAGLEIGGPFTNAASLVSGTSPESVVSNPHFILGPYVEFRLPARFALDVDALYRSFSYSQVLGPAGPYSGSNQSWEFPVLLKYKLLPGPAKPYIEGGPVLNHLTGSSLDLAHDTNYGIALGAGLEIHALVIRLSPEIRYDGFVYHDFTNNSFVQSNRNQLMVLVGIGF